MGDGGCFRSITKIHAQMRLQTFIYLFILQKCDSFQDIHATPVFCTSRHPLARSLKIYSELP